jgi:hypothetical protein
MNGLIEKQGQAEMVQTPIEGLSKFLCERGYYVADFPDENHRASEFVLEVAHSLGEVYVPEGCDPVEPIIRTAPTRSYRAAAFDRPEAIGWHSDFATYEVRPDFSIIYIARADPRGSAAGAWRLASVRRMIATLISSETGRETLNLFYREKIPFSYAGEHRPNRFFAVEPRPGGEPGLRFYAPSMRRGCLISYGDVPLRIEGALAEIERAADSVSEIVPAEQGSLLVVNNWFALHDRLRQTLSRTRPNREALLCFVSRRTKLSRSQLFFQ